MTGADYRALVRVSNKADETLALPGETCARVPAEALGWLLESGKIEVAPRAAVWTVGPDDIATVTVTPVAAVALTDEEPTA